MTPPRAGGGRLGRAWSAIGPTVAAALLGAMTVLLWHHLAHERSIDFYNPWAVARTHAALGGDPYSGTEAYSRYANALAEGSPDARLRDTNTDRRIIDPTATPLYYAAFAWLPADYSLGYGILAAALVVALLGSVRALARMRGMDRSTAWALAALTALLFVPFEVDLRVGNVNALQLAAIVAFVRWAPQGDPEIPPWRDELYLPALALLVAFKPNTLLIAAALAAHFAVVRGLRATLRGAVLCVGALGVAYAASCLYFGSARVWHEWHRSLADPAAGTLLYAVRLGNASVAKLVSEQWGGVGPYTAGLLLGAAVAFFIGCALTRYGRDTGGARARAQALLRDPMAMASLGVLLTFATSPLLWPHYEVLALIPVFHLFAREGRWDGASAWVALSCILLSRPLAGAFDAAGAPRATLTALMLAWLPLVAAMCMRLARASPSGATARPQPG